MTRKILLLSLAFVLLLCSCSNEKGTDVGYATVNGEVITVSEFEYFKSRLRSEVINYFIAEYSAKYDDAFWQTEFGGRTPEEELADRALKECVYAKIQLVLCREYGVHDDISFDALLEKAQKFNEENASSGGMVGVKSIDPESFYTYYIETGVTELKNILGEGELKPSENEINEFMKNFGSNEENRAAAYKKAVDKKYDEYIASLYEQSKIELI